MRNFIVLLSLVLAPLSAQAKPWKAITPGESTRAEVIKNFGEPSKKMTVGGKELLAYLGPNAIRGTTQAQFTVLPTGKVEQIVTFPATKLEISVIEDTYGKACSEVEKPGLTVANCYSKMLNDEFRTFFWYKRLGLVVFFGDDAKEVQSIIFTAPASANATMAGQ